MARTLSQAARAGLFSQETAEIYLVLLTIDHPDMPDGPILIANNTQDIVSNGDTYVGWPFDIELPNDEEDTLPRMRLKIDNVDPRIITAIRTIQSPPTITMTVVLASSPNTLEAQFVGFTLTGTSWTPLTVEGDLGLEDILNQAFPAGSFTPANFPGLF